MTETMIERVTGTYSLPQRLLGKTGEFVPVLGLGTGPGGLGMENEAAIALYERAIELGITYFDTAPGYDRAHVQLGEVLPRHRKSLFVASKVFSADGEEVLGIVEQSLKDLRIDQLDLVYVHCVGALDPEQVLAKHGSLAALRSAQDQGMTRYVGITAHNKPAHAVEIFKRAEVDVCMVALNPGDYHTYNFEEVVLPLARKQGAGVAAMKVYGGAKDMKYELEKGEGARPSAMATHGFTDYERAFRYGLDLPGVAINVIGMYTEKELEQNIQFALNYQPLANTEQATLHNIGVGLGKAWGEHFGPAR